MNIHLGTVRVARTAEQHYGSGTLDNVLQNVIVHSPIGMTKPLFSASAKVRNLP
jgi:hypothetical protein